MSSDLSGRLQKQLAATLSNQNTYISRINKLLSSTSNVDTTLLTVSYTLHLLHASLARITTSRLSLAARALADKLSSSDALLPGETVIATISPSPRSRLVRAEGSSKALAALLDDHRMFMRLWGLPKMWSWGERIWNNPPQDIVLKGIACSQVMCNTLYQYLENGAYLASKGVFSFSPEKISRWYVWSARFWALHVMLEFARLARTRVLRRRNSLTQTVDEKEDKIAKESVEAKWWRDVYVNAAWMPLTVHWSMENGYLGEALIAALSLFAGSFSLKQAWDNSL